MRTRLPFCALFALLAAGVGPLVGEEIPSVPVAIADFDNFDTAGEDPRRSEEHARRVTAFAELLRDNLSADGRYRLVRLTCPRSPCSAAKMRPADFLQSAHATGARLIVYGGVHKQSTLVQWALVHAIDLEKDKLVLERTFSLRGDSDEAFRRAAEFIDGYIKDIPVD